jgi:conjugal transfer pilin signal peptidase TrbI
MTSLLLQNPDMDVRLAKARRLRNYVGLSFLVAIPLVFALNWVIAHYMVAGNETESLPDKFFIVERGMHPVERGELMAFRVGERVRHYPVGMIFVKRVVGVPGDEITWVGDVVYVAGKPVGKAKVQNRFGEALESIPVGAIPSGKYFVSTTHPDSYDSRYREVGLVDDSQVAGKAIW